MLAEKLVLLSTVTNKSLDLMRKYTGNRELLHPAVTCFATVYLTLTSFLRSKDKLIKMCRSRRFWEAIPAHNVRANEHAQKAAGILRTTSFWENVTFGINLVSPIVRSLRLVDEDEKPTLPYVFESIIRAKIKIHVLTSDESVWFFIISTRITEFFMDNPQFMAAYFFNPETF